MALIGGFFRGKTRPMPSLAQRINELKGLAVRLHVNAGRRVVAVDGVCQGIEGNEVVLAPLSQGQRIEGPLEKIGAATPLH